MRVGHHSCRLLPLTLTFTTLKVRAETLFSGSSASSDTGSDSADSTGELEALPQEEHITQFEAEHEPDEVQDIVRVNLPSTKRVYHPLAAPSDTSAEHLEGPEILSVSVMSYCRRTSPYMDRSTLDNQYHGRL